MLNWYSTPNYCRPVHQRPALRLEGPEDSINFQFTSFFDYALDILYTYSAFMIVCVFFLILSYLISSFILSYFILYILIVCNFFACRNVIEYCTYASSTFLISHHTNPVYTLVYSNG